MAERVKIRGVWYDRDNAPAWFSHWVPGGLRLRRTMKTARENAVRNARGNTVENVILWSILALFALTAIWFLAVL